MQKENLHVVLSGSGTLYPLHAGALCAIEDSGYLISEITGVSGGALIAALWSSGIKGKELLTLLEENPITWRFWDLSVVPWNSLGLIKGKKIEKLIEKFIGKKTFSDLNSTNLRIVTACLDFQANPLEPRPTYWSKDTSPAQSISRAVRASMSLPGIFTPVTMLDGLRHVDGGVLNNFPLDDLYPDPTRSNVLGVRILSNSIDQDKRPSTLTALGDRILDLFVHKGKEKPLPHSIVTLKWSGSSFTPSADKVFMRTAFEVGYYQTLMYLHQGTCDETKPINLPDWFW